MFDLLLLELLGNVQLPTPRLLLTDLQVCPSELIMSLRTPGAQSNRAFECLDRFPRFFLLQVGPPEIIESIGVARIQREQFVKQCDGFIRSLLGQQNGRQKKQGLLVRRFLSSSRLK